MQLTFQGPEKKKPVYFRLHRNQSVPSFRYWFTFSKTVRTQNNLNTGKNEFYSTEGCDQFLSPKVFKHGGIFIGSYCCFNMQEGSVLSMKFAIAN